MQPPPGPWHPPAALPLPWTETSSSSDGHASHAGGDGLLGSRGRDREPVDQAMFADCHFSWEGGQAQPLPAHRLMLSRNPAFLEMLDSLPESKSPDVVIEVEPSVRREIVIAVVNAHYREELCFEAEPRKWNRDERLFVAKYFGHLLPKDQDWTFLDPGIPLSEHLRKCFLEGLYADAWVCPSDDSDSWRVPVHRYWICASAPEGVLAVKLLRWSDTKATITCATTCQEAAQIVLGREYYHTEPATAAGAEAIKEALPLAHLWDLPAVKDELVDLAMARSGSDHAFLVGIAQAACTPSSSWRSVCPDVCERVCLLLVRKLQDLPSNLQQDLSQALPAAVYEGLESCNTFFRATSHAFLDPSELLAAWYEDLTAQLHSSFEGWDSRWHFLAQKLHGRCGATLVQKPDGTPDGLLARGQAIPPELWEEYLEMRRDYQNVVKQRAAVELQCEKIKRVFPKGAFVAKDKVQEILSSLPRLCEPQNLYLAEAVAGGPVAPT
ncbi:unnamed protein product [Effrenium voratum]|nr:unnamed protein product [Effrenium voratum]